MASTHFYRWRLNNNILSISDLTLLPADVNMPLFKIQILTSLPQFILGDFDNIGTLWQKITTFVLSLKAMYKDIFAHELVHFESKSPIFLQKKTFCFSKFYIFYIYIFTCFTFCFTKKYFHKKHFGKPITLTPRPNGVARHSLPGAHQHLQLDQQCVAQRGGDDGHLRLDVGLGSILQSSVSAETFSDIFFILRKIAQRSSKIRIFMYLSIMDNNLG
jgi:hypothetical protein